MRDFRALGAFIYSPPDTRRILAPDQGARIEWILRARCALLVNFWGGTRPSGNHRFVCRWFLRPAGTAVGGELPSFRKSPRNPSSGCADSRRII